MKKLILSLSFLFLFTITPAVYAEYYLVYSTEPVVECYAYYPCQYSCSYTINIHSSAPHRHRPSRGSEQVEEYAWIPTP